MGRFVGGMLLGGVVVLAVILGGYIYISRPHASDFEKFFDNDNFSFDIHDVRTTDCLEYTHSDLGPRCSEHDVVAIARGAMSAKRVLYRKFDALYTPGHRGLFGYSKVMNSYGIWDEEVDAVKRYIIQKHFPDRTELSKKHYLIFNNGNVPSYQHNMDLIGFRFAAEFNPQNHPVQITCLGRNGGEKWFFYGCSYKVDPYYVTSKANVSPPVELKVDVSYCFFSGVSSDKKSSDDRDPQNPTIFIPSPAADDLVTEIMKARAQNGSAMENYSKQLNQRLANLKLTQREPHSGTTVVSFDVSATGQPTSIKVSSSSGSDKFDKEAFEAVRKALPFPPPPDKAPHSYKIPCFWNAH